MSTYSSMHAVHIHYMISDSLKSIFVVRNRSLFGPYTAQSSVLNDNISYDLGGYGLQGLPVCLFVCLFRMICKEEGIERMSKDKNKKGGRW